MTDITSPGSGPVRPAAARLDPISLAGRAGWVGAGVAATAVIFRHIEAALGDPLPAAIMTLLAVITVLVVLAPRSARP